MMNKLFILLFLLPFFISAQKSETIEYTGKLNSDTIDKRTEIIDAVFFARQYFF